MAPQVMALVPVFTGTVVVIDEVPTVIRLVPPTEVEIAVLVVLKESPELVDEVKLTEGLVSEPVINWVGTTEVLWSKVL